MSATIHGVPPICLVLKPDHPCNTSITEGSSGKILYTVNTEVIPQDHSAPRTVTFVRRASGDLVASFEWKGFKSDLVAFGEEEPMVASNWLKKSSLLFRETVTWKDSHWKFYKWKGFAPGLTLELYSEMSKTQPLARFQKPRVPVVITNYRGIPASLQIHPSLASSAELRDQIVLSFLYLEKVRRQRDHEDFTPLPTHRIKTRETSNLV
ncbi:hypothetical protein BDN72DRAFT_892477 [Pluteus cervinus]|uniref:Uncharacterized protein n=1 Tax=Pluteus cervinus TaxID=181527 RepID=A0ACD3BBP0_9AGAR|nr:hypothetical protein BDN72DRAFT_892477 [Pluteus cervinus]